MLHFFGILFFIIIAILIIGLSIIGTVIRGFFSLGGRRTSSGPFRRPEGHSYANPQQSAGSSSQQGEGGITPEEGEIHPKRKKLFSEDEGEYVDFEEVKEE